MRRRGQDSLESWLVMLSCSFIGMLQYGIVRLSGLLFVASMGRFGVDRQTASLPYILADFMQVTTGPVAGYFASKFGVRPVVVFGSLVSCVGIAACFSAHTIATVTIFWGVVFGFGFGLSSLLLPVIITQHFTSKRATAIGLMYVGSYVGFTVLPSVVEVLLYEYGVSGTFLWLGALVLHCVPAAMFIRQPRADLSQISRLSIMGSHSISLVPDRSSPCRMSLKMQREDFPVFSPDGVTPKNGVRDDTPLEFVLNCKVYEGTNSTFDRKSSVVYQYVGNTEMFSNPSAGDAVAIPCYIQKRQLCNSYSLCGSIPNCGVDLEEGPSEKKHQFLRIFTDPFFLLIMLSTTVYFCSFIIFVTIIVDFGMDVGLRMSDGKYIIMGFSVASNCGLLSFGWVTDGGHMSLTNFAGLMFVGRGITSALIPLSQGFSLLMVLVIIQGFVESSLANLFPLIVAEHFEEGVHEVAISSCMLLCGPVYLATPQLIGFFRDDLGSYSPLLQIISGLSVLCGILLFFAKLIRKCHCMDMEGLVKETHEKKNSSTL